MAKKLKGLVKKVWESKIKQSPSKYKHISYSQLSTYNKCPRLWELQYLRNIVPYEPSIYMVFGTAFHETLQTYLETLYMDKVKTANDLNIKTILYDNMVKAYKSAKAMSLASHKSHTSQSAANTVNIPMPPSITFSVNVVVQCKRLFKLLIITTNPFRSPRSKIYCA